MRRISRLIGAVALAAWPAGTVVAQELTTNPDSVIRDRLDITNYSMQDIALPDDLSRGATVIVRLGDAEQLITLEPWNLRTSDFKVFVDDGSGTLAEVTPPPAKTYRGVVEGVEGSIVSGAMDEDGLNIRISMPAKGGSEDWFVQPASDAVAGLPATRHVVYRHDDVNLPDFRCGVPGHGLHHDGAAESVGPRVDLYNCEIAFDADFLFYQQNGSNVNNVINDIEFVMALVTTTYERDCEITYTIGDIIVRTSAGLYNTTNPDQMLNLFRNQWNANHGNIHRDIAHLMTGQNLDGGVIGIAWLSVICSSNMGYGLSQSRFTGGQSGRAALTAHELGHNWSANHCDGNGDCHIMCSGINGCNGLGSPIRFGTNVSNGIKAYRNNRPCLDIIPDDLSLPFFDDFPATTLDSAKWETNNGGAILTDVSAPSPPRVLRLDSADNVETLGIAAQGATQPVVFSFYVQQFNVEACKALAVDALSGGGVWNEIGRVTSDGSLDIYGQHGFVVPAAYLYNGVRFRIRAVGGDANDDWDIDNVLIEANGTVPPSNDTISLPWTEPFPCDVLSASTWETISGAVSSTQGANEPSAPYSLQLNFTDSIHTTPILAGSFGGGSPLYLHFWLEEVGLEAGDALIVQYRDSGGVFQSAGIVVSTGGTQATYSLVEFELPVGAEHDNLAIRLQAAGQSVDDTWYIDDIGVSDEQLDAPDCPGNPDCIADLSPPNGGDGTLGGDDFFAFLDLFAAGDLCADLAAPFGTLDANDFFGFLDAFANGCP